MVEVERLVFASGPVGNTECFRPGPGLERCLTLPYRVGGIERVVLVLRPFEQMELDETGDLGQLRVAAQPNLLEGLFEAFLHTESVHGNEHHPSPDLDQNVTVIRWRSRNASRCVPIGDRHYVLAWKYYGHLAGVQHAASLSS